MTGVQTCALPISDDVFELEAAEVAAVLRGGPSAGPGEAEIARRRDQRRVWAALDAPEQLGPDEVPPPFHLLPPNLARITDIRLELAGQLEKLEAQAKVATRYNELHSDLQLKQHLLWYLRRRDAASERER